MVAKINHAITKIEKFASDMSWSFGSDPVVDVERISSSVFVQSIQPARDTQQNPVMMIQRHETFSAAARLAIHLFQVKQSKWSGCEPSPPPEL